MSYALSRKVTISQWAGSSNLSAESIDNFRASYVSSPSLPPAQSLLTLRNLISEGMDQHGFTTRDGYKVIYELGSKAVVHDYPLTFHRIVGGSCSS